MKNSFFIALVAICVLFFSTNVTAQNQKQTMDSLSYSLGLLMASNLKSQGFGEINSQDLSMGMTHALQESNPLISLEDANKIVQQYMTKQQEKLKLEGSKEGAAFLAENAKRKGVTVLPSGLQYEIMKEGTGEKPKATDKVKTHYHGTLIDGTVFDSSVNRGEPATFPVNGVIKGWVDALQMMPVGSKWKLFIPSDLAYGDRGAGSMIKPYSTLIFEVELLEIIK